MSESKGTSFTIATPPASLTAVILALCIGAVYMSAIDAPLIFDDVDTIIRNKSIVSLWPLVGTAERRGPLNPPANIPTSARPLVNFSFAINYFFGGLDPRGYHAVNVGLHFLATMLLWAVIRRALQLPYFCGRFDSSAGWLALGATLIWALHPLNTEAVIYATQRTELMMAVFYLATLYCSLRYWTAGSARTPRTTWLSLALFACLAGMASKEVMVSAPLIILLFDRTFISGSLPKALRRSWPFYAGLAGTWILLLLLVLPGQHSRWAGSPVGVPIHIWWLTQTKVLLLYLKLVFWPWPLLIHYQLPFITTAAEGWPYVVPMLLIGMAALWLLWRNHPAGFLVTLAFAVLAPTSVVPIMTEMAAERRMYLPLAALVVLFIASGFWLAGWTVRHRNGNCHSSFDYRLRRAGILTLVVVITLAFGCVSSKRLTKYQDEIGLWQDVLRWQPQNEFAHESMGYLLRKAGDDLAAMMHYREAVRLNPDSARAQALLADALVKQGAYDEAITHLTIAVELAPTNPAMHNNLAAAFYMTQRHNEAAAEFQAALQTDPRDVNAHYNLGKLLAEKGDVYGAIQHLQQAAKLQPDIAENHYKLGEMLLVAGRPSEAIDHFQAALTLNPAYVQAYANLARALAAGNRSVDAINMANRAIEVARNAGQESAAQQIEEWLQHYRIELGRGSETTMPAETLSPAQ